MITSWILLSLLQVPATPAAQEPAPEVVEVPVEPASEEPGAEESASEEFGPEQAPVEEPAAEVPSAAVPSAEAPETEVPEPAATQEPAPLQGPETGWMPFNEVHLIINEECITLTDFQVAVLRNRQPQTSEEDRMQQARAIRQAMITERLKTQAGRDMGFPPETVELYVLNTQRRRQKAAGSVSRLSEQLKGSEFNAVTYHRDIEASVLRELWTGAVVGEFAGVGGRMFRDRYVRPRRLKFEFEREEGGLDLPSTVSLQEMLCLATRTGSVAGAKELADRLRQEVLDGGDFGELAVANETAPQETMGVLRDIDESILARHPDLSEFITGAKPGDISEALPVRDQGNLIGWRVVKLISRKEASQTRFEDAEVQKMLRERYVEIFDQVRESEALMDLLNAAYVWPPERFGREAEPEQGAATTGDPEDPEPGT